MAVVSFSKMVGQLLIGVVFAAITAAEVPTWCGKPYMSTDHAQDPGGQFQFPEIKDTPMLYITVQPLYSIFLDSDKTGSLILDASISYTFGQPYLISSHNSTGNDVKLHPFKTLEFEIYSEENNKPLVSDSIPVDSTGKLFKFSLSSFTPQLTPYPITLHGKSPDGKQRYTSATSIFVLPSRTYGSAVRIDNLSGGLLIQNQVNNYQGWYSIFPNGYYADGKHITPTTFNLTNLNNYAEQGFNTINIVPDGGLPDQSYPVESLGKYWDLMDELNLFNIYDMRFAFMNSTRIEEQVALWKDRASLLMWYTADEPDGWNYPLNSTYLAFSQLQSLDPYHPVSLALNCQNYHYTPYSSGAHIIFEDAYPVSVNASFSIPWSTPCNTTYGDCGCDNCIGSLLDVPNRIDTLQTYQSNISPSTSDIPPSIFSNSSNSSSSSSSASHKSIWAVLQAFGNQDYWPGYPTAEEVGNMMMLSLNHGAKGITYWIYPSSSSINELSGEIGKIFDSEIVKEFIFGTEPRKGLKVEAGEVDASAWILGSRIFVGVANGRFSTGRVEISMPEGIEAGSVRSVLYGNRDWIIENGMLIKNALVGLEVSLLVLNVA